MTRRLDWVLPADKINDSQHATLEKTVEHAARAHTINIVIRKDGVETTYEADWVKYLVELPF